MERIGYPAERPGGCLWRSSFRCSGDLRVKGVMERSWGLIPNRRLRFPAERSGGRNWQRCSFSCMEMPVLRDDYQGELRMWSWVGMKLPDTLDALRHTYNTLQTLQSCPSFRCKKRQGEKQKQTKHRKIKLTKCAFFLLDYVKSAMLNQKSVMITHMRPSWGESP